MIERKQDLSQRGATMSQKELFYKIVWFMSFYILIILDMLADAFALHFKFNKIVGRDDHPLYFLLFILGYIS